jgi:Fe2+ or Zn2+ uptake regulation protein
MIETLISSKTRIKLLLKFFLNSKAISYLRALESEFGESSNGIRVELNRFEKAGMLTSFNLSNKKYFRANTEHPLYIDMHNIIMKYIGFDKIIDSVIENLGDIHKVYVIGAFAKGLDDHKIELVLIGNLNIDYLNELVDKVEKLIHRKISCTSLKDSQLTQDHWDDLNENALLLWES